MPATTTGAPFSLNVPSLSSDLADLFGTYLVPNMTAINTNAAHKGTAQTFSALQTFSAGATVSSGNVTVSSGTIILPAGSASAPSIAPSGDANTGTFYPAADTIAWATGGSERVRVNSTGNVGIGTSNPVAGLHVVSSAVNDVCIESGYPQGVTMQNGGFWEHKYASDTGELSFNYVGYQNGTSYYRDLNIYNGKYGLIARFQGSTSRVGIGTSSPSSTLHVVGDVTIAPTTGGAYHTIRGVQAGQNAHQYFYTSNALKWVQYANDSNSRLYFLDADSNDGVYIAQNTTAWVANSDSRLKDVQGTITDALAKVGQLTGVKFTWKREADNPDAKVRVGLIAQDVQAVLPEAVDDDSPDLITDEETGKVSGGLGVRYTELVPLLVNAIKELTARVVALEAQVASA